MHEVIKSGGRTLLAPLAASIADCRLLCISWQQLKENMTLVMQVIIGAVPSTLTVFLLRSARSKEDGGVRSVPTRYFQLLVTRRRLDSRIQVSKTDRYLGMHIVH